MAAFNLGNLTVDASGRASFSGITSGIDFQATTDAIIAARRIPAVTLENRITDNDEKILALNDFRALLTTLKSSISNLRGAVSIDNSTDIFANKQVFASTSRSDGLAPAAAGNLVGVTVNNATAAGTHTLEVRRIAAAHKVSSSSFTSTTTALSITGSFTVGGGASAISVTVLSTDTLLDIRDRINNTNTGVTPSGVTASIVSVSATENFLILTNDTTGANIIVTDTGSVLSSLGLSTTNGVGNLRSGISSGNKVEVADGFSQILFDGSTEDSAYILTYDN
ncbi:MAG: flagellar hook protein FliD, partial [Acidobacteria bacterium]|nr:flagellar hook protein FliD [Acidobacteriota bacterium]